MKIICTLGPASYKPKILRSLSKMGVNIFRINLSHTPQNDILNKINYLKKNKIRNICIDTEGAQIRTTKIKKRIFFKKGAKVSIAVSKKVSSKKRINLYPNFDLMQCKKGIKISIGFNNLSLKIINKNLKKKFLSAKVVNEGILEANKAVHINQNITLPSLTEKDLFAINLAKNKNVKFFAMSFVNREQDINKMRSLIKKNSFLISKVETNLAIKNLRGISKKSNALLIDRGDLSRYVPIEEIPIAQEKIIKFGKKIKKPVYVATNLLETMIKEHLPTRAESHDIYSTLKQGAGGLVLAAETAIGRDPIGCVNFLKKSIKVFYKNKKNN